MDGLQFDKVFKMHMKSRSLKDQDEVAGAISDAYDLANKSASLTQFGNKFLGSSYTNLKSDIKKCLELNSLKKKKSNELESSWIDLAEAFGKYWKGANFTQLPSPAPTIVPAPGIKIIQSGNTLTLAKELKASLTNGDTDECSFLLSNALINHQKTINGIYYGNTNGSPTPVNWIGVFSTVPQEPPKKETGIRKVTPNGGIGSQLKSVRDFETRRHFEYIEWAQLFSADGEYVSREFTSNKTDSVSWPLDLTIRNLLLGDYIGIHNHPPNPKPTANKDNSFYNIHQSPSAADFFHMNINKMYEMRVMDLIYIYIVQQPVDGHPFIAPWNLSEYKKELKNLYKSAYDNEYEKYSNDSNLVLKEWQIMRNDMTESTRNFIFYERGGTSSGYINLGRVVRHAQGTDAGARAIAKKYNLAYQKISRKKLYNLK